MTCASCKHQFCWVCEKKWNPGKDECKLSDVTSTEIDPITLRHEAIQRARVSVTTLMGGIFRSSNDQIYEMKMASRNRYI
jgi:hypothetical protein